MSARRVPVVTFEIAAAAESVPRARAWIAAFASEHVIDHLIQARIASAFNEAFTNAVLHAYDDSDDEQHITVAADIADKTFEVVVVDCGRGFRSDTSDDRLGMGLTILAGSVDEFAVREVRPTGTEVWLRFQLPE
jgi:anti-sigma regulatory factor (Ser/Thr protein kinase)